MSERISVQAAGGRRECKRALLMARVDEVLNRGAIQEAADATPALQSPNEIRDTAASAYLTERIVFNSVTAACDLCKGGVRVDRSGTVKALGCIVSGCCELFWAGRYPEHYQEADGSLSVSELPCAGLDCTAVVALSEADGIVTPEVARGGCTVVSKGLGWRKRGEDAFTGAPTVKPEAGMPAFDGVDVGDPAFEGEIGY